MSNLSDHINKLNKFLKDKNIYYLSNDPERALGMEDMIENFHIIHIDDNQYTKWFQTKNLNYFCLEKETSSQNEILRSSYQLIKHPLFLEYFNKTKKNENFIQTFKISPAFEKEVKRLNCVSLNTSANLNRKYENKLTQFQAIKDLDIAIPKTFINIISKISFQKLETELGLPFVIQFNRGHTGEGTIIVNTNDQFSKLQSKYKAREVKFSEYIDGIPYTVNAVVGKKQTFIGGLTFQITGIPELTNFPGGTVGNDWHFRPGFDDDTLNKLRKTIEVIAQKMRVDGYLGLFGVDFIVKNNEIYFIEINARQAASIPMFTKIQIKNGQIPLSLIHLYEFLNLEYEIDENEYNIENLKPFKYSQIFLRADIDSFVLNSMNMGKYNHDLDLIDSVYDINECNNDELIALLPTKGKRISEGNELARIQLSETIMKDQTSIQPWILELFKRIKNILLTKNVDHV